MTKLRLAIVGLGKIARDRHVPTISAIDNVTLVAVASPYDALPNLPHFASLDELLRDGPPVDAVVVCTPPQVRSQLAATSLAAGKHVMLEKPPGTSLSQLDALAALAARERKSLYASWHSQFAASVEPARQWLSSRRIRSVHVEWKEDVRVWHPGQDWIFQPGGFGVFDPGINALSIVTRILPCPVFVTAAELSFPANREAPIAASLRLASSTGFPVTAEFDFRQAGPQLCSIVIATDDGQLVISSTGRRLAVDDKVILDEPNAEYPLLYRHFVELSATGACDVDPTPLRLVADAFMVGKRRIVEPFEF